MQMSHPEVRDVLSAASIRASKTFADDVVRKATAKILGIYKKAGVETVDKETALHESVELAGAILTQVSRDICFLNMIYDGLGGPVRYMEVLKGKKLIEALNRIAVRDLVSADVDKPRLTLLALAIAEAVERETSSRTAAHRA